MSLPKRVLVASALLLLVAGATTESSSTSGFMKGVGTSAFLVIIALLAFIVMKRISAEKCPSGTKLPPVYSAGLPVIGNFLEFAKSPLDFIRNGKDKLGGIFTVNMLVENCTFMIGSKYHQPFFEGADEELDQADVYKFMTSVFGKGIVYDAPIYKRRQQMRALGTCLKPSFLRKYSVIIAKEAFDYFKQHWGESGQLDLHPSIAELIILTASATLLGPEVRHELFLEVSELYDMLDKGINPLSIFWPNAPTQAHAKRDKARAEMAKLFSKVIKKRRENGDSETKKNTDMLQKLIDFKYKDGNPFTDDEITGMLIAALFAGQHTSSVTSTWSTLFLLQDKKTNGGKNYDRVMNELASVERARAKPGSFASGKDIDSKVLQEENFLYGCIKEAVRLFPPLILLMRRVKKSFTTSDGFFVPKGHRLMVSNAVAQRLPEVFKNPNEYKPERWADFDMGKLPKYSFIGFGAGIHTCMGESFAFMQIQTILTVMFSMYDMELVSPFPEADYESMVVPPKGPNMVKYVLRKDADMNTLEKKYYASAPEQHPQKTANSTHGEDSVIVGDDNIYTLEEISKHNKKHDAWLVAKGSVYDVTNYVHLHQGGENAILKWAGKADATEAVFGPQHPKTVPTLLERFKIGIVDTRT